jgi:hypothetical protein
LQFLVKEHAAGMPSGIRIRFRSLNPAPHAFEERREFLFEAAILHLDQHPVALGTRIGSA